MSDNFRISHAELDALLQGQLERENDYTPMPVDPKVYELARHFLEGNPLESTVMELAERIQDTIEDWCILREIDVKRSFQP